MKNIHLIWDFDGTLVDSGKDVFESLDAAVQREGLSKTDQVADYKLGPTIDKILDISFPPDVLSQGKKEAIIKRFRQIYDNCDFKNTVPFVGIEKIINDNKFIHHILTNKPDLVTKKIIFKLNWAGVFSSVVTPYSFLKEKEPLKNKRELFAFLKKEYLNDILIGIGDMPTDCLAAKTNGLIAIGVLWGTGTKNELEESGCDIIVESPDNLYNYLLSQYKKIHIS